MTKPQRMAECHPDRPHEAHGLCTQCYSKKQYEKNHEYILEQHSKWCENNKEHIREYNSKTSEYRRNQALKTKYGITIEDYDKLLETQSNGCAICGKTPEKNGRRLYVDHDHETGIIRGLLCRDCNLILGFAHDNISTLARAINYLEENQHNGDPPPP